MMYMPSILNDNFMEDMFDSMFSFPFDYKCNAGQMNTDITDCGDTYELEIELPGYAKEDIKADLRDGYLTITAQTEKTNETNEEEFIRKERFQGKCSRRYFVGKQLTIEDISAKFENGILCIQLPKKQEVEENEKLILIE